MSTKMNRARGEYGRRQNDKNRLQHKNTLQKEKRKPQKDLKEIGTATETRDVKWYEEKKLGIRQRSLKKIWRIKSTE